MEEGGGEDDEEEANGKDLVDDRSAVSWGYRGGRERCAKKGV